MQKTIEIIFLQQQLAFHEAHLVSMIADKKIAE